MLSQHKTLSNFSRAIRSQSTCFRPDNEWQVADIYNDQEVRNALARGQGLSYSDCCLNQGGIIIDCQRLNHLLSFDPSTGLLYCQAGVTFADLFSLHPEFIPPVIPGTLYATLGGGIANDVHGKNNHRVGSLGEHVKWVELQIGSRLIRCSQERHSELFRATIGGLGLTGIIRRVAITLRKATRYVENQQQRFTRFDELLNHMAQQGIHYDYQAAWLDLLNPQQALLSLANHCESAALPVPARFSLPKLPFRLINHWAMKQFNHYYFKWADTQTKQLPLVQFNNPLDSIKHWNHLYGKHGLLQFQAVFAEDNASSTLDQLIRIMQNKQAVPTLAVLKYFTKPGSGLLSFVKPGFTIAIDFINNVRARAAIEVMNDLITNLGGQVYLAKDLLLNRQQFVSQYRHLDQFNRVLNDYHCNMQSDLGRRLGLTPS